MHPAPRCKRHDCALEQKPWPLPFGYHATDQPLVCLECVADAKATVHRAMIGTPQGRAAMATRRLFG